MKNLLFVVMLIISIGCKKDEIRTSILGSWNCEEYSDFGQRKYQVNIARNIYLPKDTNEYIINNFHNLGLTESNEVYVRVIEPGKLTITGTASLGMAIIGTGDIAGDFSKIEWTYQVIDGKNNPNVFATYY